MREVEKRGKKTFSSKINVKGKIFALKGLVI